jgi:hypothetical protein
MPTTVQLLPTNIRSWKHPSTHRKAPPVPIQLRSSKTTIRGYNIETSDGLFRKKPSNTENNTEKTESDASFFILLKLYTLVF